MANSANLVCSEQERKASQMKLNWLNSSLLEKDRKVIVT